MGTASGTACAISGVVGTGVAVELAPKRPGAVESGVVTAGAGTGSGVVCLAAAKGSLALAISGVVGTGVAEELAPKKPGAVESGVVTAGAGTGSGVVCRAAAKGSLALAISGVVGTGVAEELAPKKPGAVESGVVTAGAGTGSGVVCLAAAKGSFAVAISGVVGTGVAVELAPKGPGADAAGAGTGSGVAWAGTGACTGTGTGACTGTGTGACTGTGMGACTGTGCTTGGSELIRFGFKGVGAALRVCTELWGTPWFTLGTTPLLPWPPSSVHKDTACEPMALIAVVCFPAEQASRDTISPAAISSKSCTLLLTARDELGRTSTSKSPWPGR